MSERPGEPDDLLVVILLSDISVADDVMLLAERCSRTAGVAAAVAPLAGATLPGELPNRCQLLTPGWTWSETVRDLVRNLRPRRVLLVPPTAEYASVAIDAHRDADIDQVLADVAPFLRELVPHPDHATVGVVAHRGFSLPAEQLCDHTDRVPRDLRTGSDIAALIHATGCVVRPMEIPPTSWSLDEAISAAQTALEMARDDPETRRTTGLTSDRRAPYQQLLVRRSLIRLGSFGRFVTSDCQALNDASFWRAVRRSGGPNEPSIRPGIPILMYHAFSKDERSRYVVAQRTLRWQLRLLRIMRRRVISLDRYVSDRREGLAPPRRSVVITIDDGYADVYDVAAPELARRGWSATLFVPSARVGEHCDWSDDVTLARRPLATWHQLRAGMPTVTVGSHGKHHEAMTDMNPRRLRDEFDRSAEELEEHIGQPVTTFAYPYGARDQDIDQLGITSRYEAICTSIGGLNLPDEPLHRLRRIEVRGDRSLATFVAAVTTGSTTLLSRSRST